MADLDALETFATAVRTGSFAAAARVLGITPAMVGRRIQGLEQRHGVRLIERTTRAQRLTEAGETFLRRAEAVLDAALFRRSVAEQAHSDAEAVRTAAEAEESAHRRAAIVARARHDLLAERTATLRRRTLLRTDDRQQRDREDTRRFK